MTPQLDVEEALLRAFIVPERRGRYVARLRAARDKLMRGFFHLHDLDPRFAQRIEPRRQFAPDIYEDLRRRGASERISCVTAKLAYFEREETNERYILDRRAGTP